LMECGPPRHSGPHDGFDDNNKRQAMPGSMDKARAILAQRFQECNYTAQQAQALRHIAQHVPKWYGWEPGQKVPSARRGPGDTPKPDKAMGLDEALAEMARQGWGGVSALMTSADAGLVGIDIDRCIRDGAPTEIAG